jgi:hypothetical protein
MAQFLSDILTTTSNDLAQKIHSLADNGLDNRNLILDRSRDYFLYHYDQMSLLISGFLISLPWREADGK